MKLRYKTTIVVAGFVVLLSLAASLFIAFQPDPRYDREKVHPRLLSLQQPYKTVRTYYFMDGGSIGIEIVDREGRKEQFAVLALMGEPNPYTRVLVGGLHHRAPGAVELHDPESTRRMLICVLSDYPNRKASDNANLARLRGYTKDSITLWYHRCRGDIGDDEEYIY